MYRVCFVTPLARPILDPGFACDFGGAEVRASNFANGLAARGNVEVAMLLRSYGAETPRMLGNLRAHFEPIDRPIPRTKDLTRDRFFLLRLLQVKLQKLKRSLRKRRTVVPTEAPCVVPQLTKLPADLLCCFGVHAYSANVVASARAAKKKSLLFVAHDQDVDFVGDVKAIAKTYGGNAELHRYVIEQADGIVTQTPHQQSIVRERFGRDASVVRNPIDLRPRFSSDTASGKYILWVGRADTFFKRADKMLQLAARCPDVPFVAIMNKRNDQVFENLMKIVPPNVNVVGHVPYDQIEDYYANATALLSTSEGEGFPNAFLQAGKYGKPILSLNVDPGEMLSQHGCGVLTGGDLRQLEQTVRNAWQDRESSSWHGLSKNILRYVAAYHGFENRIAELERSMLDLLGDRFRDERDDSVRKAA